MTSKDEKKNDLPNVEGGSIELSELMMAHLDEVEGGGGHSSWRRVASQLVTE